MGCVCSCWGSLSALVLAPQGDWAQPPSGSLLVLALGPAEVLEAGRAPGPLSSNPSPFQRRRPQRKGFAPFFPSSSWRGQPPPTCLLAFAPPASRHLLNIQSELQSGPEVGPQVRGSPRPLFSLCRGFCLGSRPTRRGGAEPARAETCPVGILVAPLGSQQGLAVAGSEGTPALNSAPRPCAS